MSNLAIALLAAGHTERATALGERVLALRREVLGPGHPDTVTSMNNLAAAYHDAGRTADWLRLAERVLALRTELQGERHPSTLIALGTLAAAYQDAGRPADAAALSSRYVDGAEWQRAQPGLTPENRQTIFRVHAERYRQFARLHAFLGDLDEGFRLSELSKARTLLEGVALRHAGRSGLLPEAEQAQLERLDRQAAELRQVVARSSDPEERLDVEARQNTLARQYQALQDRLRREHPRYAQASDVRLVAASELAGLVPEGASAISYVVYRWRGVTAAWAWVAGTDGRLHYRDLGLIPNLHEVVEAVRRAAGNAAGLAGVHADDGLRVWRLPGEGGYRLLAAEAPPPPGAQPVDSVSELTSYLARRLLEPLAALIGASRQWIVSPDAALAQLPFELLPFGSGGAPVIAAVDIHYTQSLSMLAQGRARQRQYDALAGRKTLFAMGNPVYQPGRAEPAPRRSLARHAAPGSLRALHQLDAVWQNLPGTEREIRAVAALFEGAASVHLGPQATEHRLRALDASGELAAYRYLLFSAHGYLSQDAPSLSSLVLGLVDRAPDTDGYVTAAEWTTYDLRSDLVVLSACDTGVGRVVSGEGVTGLPFALFLAGNLNTILSLWPVDDDATAAFMQALFTRLKAGAGPARALNETKRQFLLDPDSGRRRNPAVWAPFILVGPG